MTRFNNFFNLLQREFAARKLSSYDLSLIMAFVYFLILKGELETTVATISSSCILLSLFGMIGLNSISFTSFLAFNGKQYPIWLRNGIYGALTLLMLAPWYYLPLNTLNSSLLAIEILLILGMNVVQRRSLETGLTHSVLSLFSFHLVPLTIVFSVLHSIGIEFQNTYQIVGLVLIWQLIMWARKHFNQAKTSAVNIVIAAETLVFCALAFYLFESALYTWIIFGLAAIGLGLTFIFGSKERSQFSFDKDILDRFYYDWFALIFLVGIIFIKTEVTLIFLLHLIFLRNAVKTFLLGILRYLQRKALVKRLFTIEHYKRALRIHLIALVTYTLLFCAVYKVLELTIDDAAYFFEIQKILSKLLVFTILFHGVLIVLTNKQFVRAQLKTFALEKGSAYTLAVFRIIFFLIIIGAFYGEVFRSFEQWTHLPDSARTPLPFIGWLIDILPITPEFYKIMGVTGLGLAISIFLGFKTRFALLLYIPVALYLWGVPNFFGKLNHRHIMVWIPIFMALSPCADVLSIDSLLRRIRKKHIEVTRSVHYAIPFKMIWITLGIIYAASGFHKLWDTGLFWALSDNLKNQIQLEWVEQYDTITSIRIDQYPLLLNIGAMGVILMEIIYPVLILKSYTRIFAVIGAFSLHLSAGYFLFIDFFHLRVANLTLIDWANIKLKKSPTADLDQVKPLENPEKINFRRMPIIYLGGSLILFNLVFSFFQISSWPFSAYPSYSAVVPNQVDLVQMDATDINGETIDIKQIGKEANFRWETIRPFEQDIARLSQSEDTTGLHNKLYSYWQLWETKVDFLSEVRQIKMSLITTELVPEKRQIVLDSLYLGEINLKKSADHRVE